MRGGGGGGGGGGGPGAGETVRLKPDTTDTQAILFSSKILLISLSPVRSFLLRKDEPLFDAGGIAKKNRLRIDRDDGEAAGD